MKAIVNESAGRHHLVCREVPEPEPAKDEVKVRVKAAGVCGTDIHIWNGLYKTATPVIIGHEFCGEIVETGEAVLGWKAGQRVVAENFTGACGVCRLCRSGKAHICSEKAAYGTDRNGCMAEYFCVPANSLHLVSDNISDNEASILEPLAVVNRALIERSPIKALDRVVILGAGAIGLLSAQVAKIQGASQVILVGTQIDETVRFEFGRKVGATHIVNLEKSDFVKEIYEITSGEGGDVVVEASGSTEAVSSAFQIVNRSGKIVAIGLTGNTATTEWDMGVFKEIDIIFSKSSTYMSWRRAISFVKDGIIDLEDFCTAVFPIEEWEGAFNLMAEGKAVKTVLIP
jgi:L-iditol 2-dehydrogenase